MIFQNSINYRNYIHDYQELVYRYYSKEYIPYEITYYNIDIQNSVVDNDILEGGSYSILGEKSGWKWSKIYFFPVFFIEPISSVTYESSDRGVIQTMETSFVFPDTYGVIPNEHDLAHLHFSLDPNNTPDTLFIVKSIEKDNISNHHFFKCSCEILKYNPDDITNHISNQFIFVDYLKKILDYNTGLILTEFIDKLKTLTYELQTNYNHDLNLFTI